jgi:hypothetical protein
MSAKENIPRDNSGIPMLCYHNPTTGLYEPVNGAGNAQYTAMRYYDVLTPVTAKANNATVSITRAGTAGLSWYIGYMNYRITGGTAGGTDIPITVTDSVAGVIYESNIAKTSAEGSNNAVYQAQPIKITAGAGFTYSVGASGSAGTYVIINMGIFQR